MSAQPHSGPISRQALSDQHKEAVKSWVPKVRQILEEEFAAQLERLGLKRNGKHSPLEKMSLPETAVGVRRRIEALLARDIIAEGTPERGFDNVKRELAYTLLNRLVGLKAMEARNLLFLPPPQTPNAAVEQTEVITPISGQSRSRFLRDFRAAGGDRYKYEDDAEEALLRDGLTAAFRHITQEIRVLFDPDHEYASIWPTHAMLASVLKMINEELPEDAYRAQDFLGWVYQFFNREEKKRVREENKGTPRTSYELAVINQFYTPSWVVKALVDNTLGRLWLQMHPDSALAPAAPPPLPDERISDLPVADYLVPRTGERIRYQRLTEDGQVETFKRARDITLLDPACGTMHFGQYAFGLFHRMYLDEIENAGKVGWPAAPSVRDPRDIPAAILEHNLFGIDIDPRAIQIASLSLLLTAKEAALRHGFSPLDVKVRRTNLVVANAVDLGEDRLRALVDHIGGRIGAADLRHRLFKVVWENLTHVAELGSLIQVREAVDRVLDDWVTARAREKGMTKTIGREDEPQLELGSIGTQAERQRALQLELEHKVFEAEAQQLQQELLAAIEAEAAQAGGDPTERLFAEDTARGLKLIQILSHLYDVVVMNPPYGSPTADSRAFIDAAYPLGRNDIYCAFVVRSLELLTREGYLGALTSRGFFTGPRPQDFRCALLGQPYCILWLADLGPGILDDATVNTAAYVVSKQVAPDGVVAIYDLEADHSERERIFSIVLNGGYQDRVYLRPLKFFQDIPDKRLAYRLLASLQYAFAQFLPLFEEYLSNPSCIGQKNFKPKRAGIIQGPIPVPLDRFVRQHWELPRDREVGWMPVVKGGEFGRFFFSEDLVLDWRHDGQAARAYAKEKYGSESRTIKNDRYFGIHGLTYPRVSSIGLSCRRLQSTQAFTDSGPVMFFTDRQLEDVAFVVLNSSLALCALDQFNPSRKTEINDMALFPLTERLPLPAIECAESICTAKQEWATGLEPLMAFIVPHMLQVAGSLGIVDRVEAILRHETEQDAQIRHAFATMNQFVLDEYHISEEDRRVVDEANGHVPPESVWPAMFKRSKDQRRMEHVWRLLSYAVKRVLDADDDGIIPFNAVNGEPGLIDRVRHELAALFPGRDANQVEVEIVNELKPTMKGYRKCASLDEWLGNAFFEYHCGLYKSRPIFWHIASAQGTSRFAFGALVHYHRFDKNRMAKLRASYLRDAIEEFRREAGLADKAGRTDDRLEWQAKVEEAQAFDQKLRWIQEGHHDGPGGGDHDYRILTPWKSPSERPQGWDPDLDDGVKVNIEPFEKAGALRVTKVT